MKTKITRLAPGFYEVTVGNLTAEIFRNDMLEYEYGQWVVSANWDRLLYTDPILYLRDAKRIAIDMINRSHTEETSQ